jgi:3'-5' exoribonuclease
MEIMAAGTRDANELVTELRDLVRGVADSGLRALLGAVFGDADLMTRFKISPATATGHHAHLGGLLEHTVGVGRVCQQLASVHEQLDSDLLLVGALLHDIGVVDEIGCEAGIERTDEGRFLGHAILGERRVRAAVERLGAHVTREAGLAISHMLLSHHADGSVSSSGRPLTLEALALHHADALDAEIAGFIDVATRASVVGESWTAEANLFGRSLKAPRASGEIGLKSHASARSSLARSA